jgi:putative membrane protein
MRWGVLFRREIHLTYDRVQDIHLVSNVVERWLGLGRVKIQTASGSAKAEMTIEGLEEFELVRDFLYSRMRGLHRPTVTATTGDDGEVAAALRQAAAELRALRQLLAADRQAPAPDTAGAETPNSEAPSR